MSPPELKGEKDGNKITEMSVRDFALKYNLDQNRLEQVFDLKNLTGKKITDEQFRSILSEAKVGSEVYERFSIYSMPPYMKTTDFAFSNRAKIDALLNFLVNASDEKADGSESKANEVRKSIYAVLGNYMLVLEKEGRQPLLARAKPIIADVGGEEKKKAEKAPDAEDSYSFSRLWNKTKGFFTSGEKKADAEGEQEEARRKAAPAEVSERSQKSSKEEVEEGEKKTGELTAWLKSWFRNFFAESKTPAAEAEEAKETRAQAKSGALGQSKKDEKEEQKAEAEKATRLATVWKAFKDSITFSGASKSKEKPLSEEGLQDVYGFSAQNAASLLRLAGSEKGVSKSELVEFLADSGLSFAYASRWRTRTWDAEALLGLLEKRGKSMDEELDSKLVMKKITEGLSILKSAKGGEIGEALSKSVKNKMFESFYSLSGNVEIKGDFISGISLNLGVSEEAVKRYCEEFGISSKESMLKRMEQNNYHDLWRKEFWGKVVSYFMTRNALLRNMLDEKDEKEMVRYATQFEAAMLAELSAKKARAETLIPKLIPKIGRLEDVKIQGAGGKLEDMKLSPLGVLGLAYDGVESIREQMPELVGKVAKEKYLDDTLNVLAEALFRNGKMREDNDLRGNLAVATSTIGSGYFFVIGNEATYEGGELLKQYQQAVQDMGKRQKEIESLVKEGSITKGDAKKYNTDAIYVSTYSMLYQMYKNAASVDPENKEQVKKLGISEADMLKYASASASSVIITGLQDEYVHHMDKKDREGFNHARDAYQRHLNEIGASLDFRQSVDFYLSLINTSVPGEKAYAQWKPGKENAKKGYYEFVAERIEQKWAQAVSETHFEAMNEAIAKTERTTQSGETATGQKIENNAENRKLYADLAFKGFLAQDIVFANAHLGRSMKDMSEAYSALEKDPLVQQAIREKANGKNGMEFTGKYSKYSDLLVKTLLPRLALARISEQDEKEGAKRVEDSLLAISKIDVMGIIKRAKELGSSKDDSGVLLPMDRARVAEMNHRAFLFLQKCQEVSPIGYSTWQNEQRQVAAAPVEAAPEERKLPDNLENLFNNMKKMLMLGVDLYYTTGPEGYQNIRFLGGKYGSQAPELIGQVQELFNELISEKFIEIKDLRKIRGLIQEDKVPTNLIKNKAELLKQVDNLIAQAEKNGKVDFGKAAKYDSQTIAAVHIMQVWAREVLKVKNGDPLGEVTVIDRKGVEKLRKSGAITEDLLKRLYSKDEDEYNGATEELVQKGIYDKAFKTTNVKYVRTNRKDDLNDGYFGPVSSVAIRAAAEELAKLIEVVPKKQVMAKIEPMPAPPVIQIFTVPAPQTYTRPDLIAISAIPEASTIVPVLPYHSLFVPQEPLTVTLQGLFNKLDIGYLGVPAENMAKIAAELAKLMVVDKSGQFTNLPTRAQAEAIIQANGVTRAGDVKTIIDKTFTTDPAGKITGVQPSGSQYTQEDIEKKFKEAQAQLLKEMKPIALGLLYRGEAAGVQYSLLPTVTIPMGQGEKIYSIAASAQILNYNRGPFSFGGTVGGIGSATGGLSPLAALTLGYNGESISPFLMAGIANGEGMFGAGTSFQMGKNIYSVSGTYAPGLFGVISAQIDRPGFAVAGISALILGGLVIPMPFLIGDITRPVNYALEASGAIDRTLDTVARAGELRDILPKKAGAARKTGKGE